MFTTSCFIKKNTPELRKKLEELGYKNYGNPFQVTDDDMIFTTLDGFYVPYVVEDRDDSWYDCGTDEDLFLALAALRDDTDYMQWFVNTGTRHQDLDKARAKYGYSKLTGRPRLTGNGDLYPYAAPTGDFYLSTSRGKFNTRFQYGIWHKATAEELITHFKKEK